MLTSLFVSSSMFCSFASVRFIFFFSAPAASEFYTLSLHDALPICSITPGSRRAAIRRSCNPTSLAVKYPTNARSRRTRSEEHTSELQSRRDLVCRLLLEKKIIALQLPHREDIVLTCYLFVLLYNQS